MFDIRPATIDDATELQEFAIKTWVDEFGDTVSEETKNKIMAKTRSLEYITYSVQNIPTLLATSQSNASIIGYVQASKLDEEITELFDTSPEDRQIDRIYVDLAHQGKSIGNALLKTALELPYLVDTKNIYLSVDKDNERAQNLYRKYGFKDTGKKIAFEAEDGPPLIDAVFKRTSK